MYTSKIKIILPKLGGFDGRKIVEIFTYLLVKKKKNMNYTKMTKEYDRLGNSVLRLYIQAHIETVLNKASLLRPVFVTKRTDLLSTTVEKYSC